MIEYNKRFVVTVDATEVNEKGQQLIQRLLYYADLPSLPKNWDWSRCIQKGEFRGKFPRRVATYCKKVHDKKISSDMLTCIGNRVDRHSFGGNTYTLDFTWDLNWNAGDFGDKSSCFWGCRELARKALMENGVIAVRLFKEDAGYARAFVLRTEEGLIVFNAYGLGCRVIAYALATLFDYPYRKEIDLYIRGDLSNLIWLNEDAYQVSSKPPSESVTVDFEVPYAYCECCEEFCPIEEGYYEDDVFMCYECQ